MHKFAKATLCAVCLVLFCSAAFALTDNTVLPEPKQEISGMTVLEAINNRSSARRAPFEKKDELTATQISTIVYAASGQNRPDKGWTVPMAMGSAPYVDVYVLLRDGVYKYDWKKNIVGLVSDKNAIPSAAGDTFIETAPCVLVFTTNSLSRQMDYAYIAVGSMSQNVYLVCETLGLKARLMVSANKTSLANYLRLSPMQQVLAIMPVGHQN